VLPARDPVNLVWFLGRDNYTIDGKDNCRGTDERSGHCVEQHFRDTTKSYRFRLCNGDHQRLGFITTTGARKAADENFSLSTSVRCRNQGHIRLYNDEAHGHSAHAWVVSPAHHEKSHFIAGHEIDRDWEAVEYDILQSVSTGDSVYKNRCVFYDWKGLAGSAGKPYKGRTSDGFISRVSWQSREDCNGA